MTQPLVGVRFAPSPTGRFHLGNLRTAWISAEWAKRLREPWIVRFEDIDLPRVVAGARESQLADLERLGIRPDRVYLQRDRHERHFALFVSAVSEETLYPCTCSRKEVEEALAGLASAPHAELPLYTGVCRALDASDVRGRAGAAGVAWRFRSPDETGSNDFIVARTLGEISEENFVPAYHWACAIDDFDGSYRLLVRAADLATSTPLQRQIQSWIVRHERLDREFASVFHASLVVQSNGRRLEKRTAGVTLPEIFASGLGAAEVIDRFRASALLADFPEPSPGLVFGEGKREITLSELGF